MDSPLKKNILLWCWSAFNRLP